MGQVFEYVNTIKYSFLASLLIILLYPKNRNSIVEIFRDNHSITQKIRNRFNFLVKNR